MQKDRIIKDMKITKNAKYLEGVSYMLGMDPSKHRMDCARRAQGEVIHISQQKNATHRMSRKSAFLI